LPIYYCYEGQVPPAALAGVSRLLGAGVAATTYQGWGITCLGPHPLRLHGDPPMPGFEIGSTHTGWITPTQPITLSHYVLNLSNAPVTLTLSYSSSLDLPWGIYSGTWQAPTLPLVPITEPLRLKAPTGGMRDVRTFWLIGSAPAGTPAGAETLIITARDVTSPARSVWTSDLVWVGDWVAPPTPIHWRALHLPLLLRRSP
jgi:hypothetical protein